MNSTQISATVHPADKRDSYAIRQLAIKTWYLHYPGIITIKQIEYMLDQRYALQEIDRLIASPSCTWFKIEMEQTMLGFGHFEEDASMRSVKVDKLYIHPKNQGQGCGTTLMRFAEAHYGKLGFGRMWLQVNKRNQASIKFYQKAGYKKEKEIIVDIGQGFIMDDFIMSKKIN
ncbi:GNAT family N-acetyltransferase [Burkholderiales bacterium]|nr:GNAT family N-acetyltransferase [Burkholderiales bacterium]